MIKYEEQIGVRLPGGLLHLATVKVGALESDEEILARISTEIGTLFNVTGTRYIVTSSKPFKLKQIKDDAEPVESKVRTQVKTDSAQGDFKKLESHNETSMPAVGECWRPRDPRRVSSFFVKAIEGDHAVTDDGRRIQLARFVRYDKVQSLVQTSGS